MKYIKLFENHSNYEDFVSGGTMEKPNVSHCVEENEVHYSQKKLSDEYLTFEILSDGVITWRHTNRSASSLTISYSLDDGKTWSDIESTYSGETFNVSNGDKVLFKGTNTLYGTTARVESDGSTSIISVPHTFSGSTASFNIRGNILSLFYGDDFADKKTYIHVDTIIGMEKLMPAIFGSTNVISAENLLLCDDFWINGQYGAMFVGCTYLTNAPKLPFTTLADGCYSNMFSNCTSLTTAPQLPATTLASDCYEYMFYGCTSLTTAPELPATTLASYCYYGMFRGCTSLNYIKAMFTTTPSAAYTTNWVSGVASTGTFVKNAAAQWNVTGSNGIPSGWTVQTATA